MRYLGGKSAIASDIAAYIHLVRGNRPYWEPFVGAAWVLAKVRGGVRYASDANGALVEMWRAVQGGWEPPKRVSEAEYQAAKRGEYPPHLEAFIGFGCSYGGRWFKGYARGVDNNGKERNFPAESSTMIMRKLPHISTAHFFHADFLATDPPAPSCVVYCDPPYNGTSDYGAVGKFDTPTFWERVRQLEAAGHTCIVSEYEAPPDFSVVWEKAVMLGMHTANGDKRRVERLYRLGNHMPLQGRLF